MLLFRKENCPKFFILIEYNKGLDFSVCQSNAALCWGKRILSSDSL